jgi:uncharacterized protein YcaQ
LLSPFDNLIADRSRTEALFGLRYRLEIYTPRTKRVHGYFAMPVLAGDRLIGTVEPILDRDRNVFAIHQGHVTSAVDEAPGTADGVDRAVRELAGFLGAERVRYGRRFPAGWRGHLRSGPLARRTTRASPTATPRSRGGPAPR